jgi:GNAT superfamily N-acetyltransferase
MQIRPATPDDRETVAGILAASYPLLMRAAYRDELLARTLPGMTRANPGLLASGTYYLAEPEPGLFAGCGGWSDHGPGGGGREPGIAHIRHFATHPDWTGRGVGRALYERCETDARAAGFVRFTCFASLNGEPFYRAVGFTAVRMIEVPMGAGVSFPSILMTREIGPEIRDP